MFKKCQVKINKRRYFTALDSKKICLCWFFLVLISHQEDPTNSPNYQYLIASPTFRLKNV